MKFSKESIPILGTVDRIEGKFAIIKLDFGAEIIWPTNRLSFKIKEGQRIKLDLKLDKTETKKQEVAIRKTLKNLLKGKK